MTTKIRLLIVDDFAEARESISKLLTLEPDIEVVGVADDGITGVQAAGELQPDIVLMDINMPSLDGITATERLISEVPATQVIMMSVQGQADYMRRAMVAGARDYLVKPFSADELAAAVRRVYELGAERRARWAERPLGGVAEAQPPQSGRVVCIFSPKGGLGRTMLACNLAISLRQLSGKRVALVDGNLAFGDVGMMLNLEGRHTIVDLVPAVDDLGGGILERVLVEHASGVRVLLAPPRPEMAEMVTAEHITKILHALKDVFDYVVVDTWTSFQDVMLAVLDVADPVLVLTTLDVPAVKNTRLFLELCQSLGYPAGKLRLVLNRADSTGGLSVDAIERSLRFRFAVALPSAGPLVTGSINRGVPFVLSDPDAPISQEVVTMARLVLRPGDELPPQQYVQSAAAPEAKALSFGRLKVPVFSRRGGD